jgi:hypothetical protein
MKSVIFISYVLLLTGFALAQEYKPYNFFNKEAELQRFTEKGGKVEELSPNIYRLTNRLGESRTFYLGSKENGIENNESVDTTIINIWEIDTTKYADKFKFWQQVQVANLWWAPLPIGDLNMNEYPELYGFTDTYIPNLAGPVKIFERNTNGIYQNIFSYDSATVYVKGFSDFNGNGNKEIILASRDNGGADVWYYPVYKSDSAGNLPKILDFFFYLDTLQINNITFGDWDKNGKTDCALITASLWEFPMCIIAEYRDSIGNFEELFRFQSFVGDIAGFAINDFDQDGKTELVFSSGPGYEVFIVENKDENEYSIVNQFQIPIPNSYMQTSSNDIDGNGKPEFWIGGQNFSDGITVFQCYEAGIDNNYKPVTRLELRYLVSFYNYYIQAVDIDNDGKDELIISVGNVILILKFTGSANNHQYKLWYAKLGEATQPGAQFYPTAIADLDGDGKKDLLIPMSKYTPSIIYAFSYLLRRNGTTGLNELKNNKILFESILGYPNPFNSKTKIRFNIIETSKVQIMIFNTLGKEINLLLNEELSPGKYSISWDAKDEYGNSLPSGIYLVLFKTKNSVKTFKSILLK